jgi:hypothetical protein
MSTTEVISLVDKWLALLILAYVGPAFERMICGAATSALIRFSRAATSSRGTSVTEY